jgi:hypothetical protein
MLFDGIEMLQYKLFHGAVERNVQRKVLQLLYLFHSLRPVLKTI